MPSSGDLLNPGMASVSPASPAVQVDSLTLLFLFNRSVCLTFCDLMDRSLPGFPVLHHLPEFAQNHVNRVSDAIQPSHPLSSPSPPTFNLSQHQGLFK